MYFSLKSGNVIILNLNPGQVIIQTMILVKKIPVFVENIYNVSST